MKRILNFFKTHKKLDAFLIAFLVIFVILATYIGIGVYKAKSTVSKLQTDISYLKDQQKAKSLDGIVTGLNNVNTDITSLKSNVAYFAPLNFVPFVNGYYQNAQHIVNALDSIDQGAIVVAQNSEPIANALGYGSNPIAGTAKVGAFVHGLPVLTNALNKASSNFTSAQQELSLVDPNYLPSVTYKGINFKNDFTKYDKDFSSFVDFIPQLNSLAPEIQTALGDQSQKNYLLVFQNDKELRPTGGFFTAYGYLTFTDGNLGEIHTTDIYNISNDQTEKSNPPAPIQLQQYNAATTWHLRDMNTSPDVPTTSELIEHYYNRLPASVSPHIDGIVYIDTQFVASLLDAVGPVYIAKYNKTIDSSNFAYNLELYSEKIDVNNPPATRKEFINLLMSQIKQKVFSAQKDSLISLLQVGMNDFSTKDIQAYSNDPAVEDLLVRYNWGGVFPSQVNGDFFGLIEANLGGAKANFYIQRNMTQTMTKTSSGYLKTVTIKYTNPQIYDDWLNGPYHAWVRFYVPQGSKFVSLSGVDTYYPPYKPQSTFRTYNDLGDTVFDTHITVPVRTLQSQSAATLTVTLKYYLPTNFDTTNGYSLYVYKQAGMHDLPVNVEYNGNSQSKDLSSDNTFTF